ncbi:MAG: FecR domain-containing protein, partial [Candidatus Omnitrophica bacterium]|nr:FecR domain-containing protein [Candidatus Omnitrophota bacterium]
MTSITSHSSRLYTSFILLESLLLFMLCAMLFLPSSVRAGEEVMVTISEIKGEVAIVRADGTEIMAQQGMALSAQDTIQTAAGASLSLRDEQGNAFFVDEERRIKVAEVIITIRPTVLTKDHTYIIVTECHGKVQIVRAGLSEWSDCTEGMLLTTGDTVRTLLGSQAVLTYPDETTLTLIENSILEIKDISHNPKTGVGKRELKLNLGNLKYNVTPLENKGSEFKIYSSTAIVGITGTEGIISTQGEGKPTSNILIEGTTYNSDVYGRTVKPLTAGNTLVVDKGAKTEKHRITPKEQQLAVSQEVRSEYRMQLSEFIAEYEKLRTSGIRVDAVQDVVDRLSQLCEQRQYDAFDRALAEARKTLGRQSEKMGTEGIALLKEVSAFEALLQEKGGDCDIHELGKLYVQLEQIKQACGQSQFVQAGQLFKRCRITFELLQSQQEKETGDFQSQLERLKADIVTKNERGFMVAEALSCAWRAEIAAQAGSLPQAWTQMAKARQMLSVAKCVKPPSLDSELSRVEKEVNELRSQQFVVEHIVEIVREAKKEHHDGRYLQTQLLLEEALSEMERVDKKIPAEVRYLREEIGRMLTALSGEGYDISMLTHTLDADIEPMLKEGEFEKAQNRLTELQQSINVLPPPYQFAFRFQRLQYLIEACSQEGYDVKEYSKMVQELHLLLEAKKLQKARLLLGQALDGIRKMKDTIPPTLQLADLEFTADSVIVHGLAKDNVKIDIVLVNGTRVKPDETGAFSVTYPLTGDIRNITCVVRDSSGNRSPTISLTIPDEKASVQDVKQKAQLKQKDFQFRFVNGALEISGKTVPGARLLVAGRNVVVPSDGSITMRFSAADLDDATKVDVVQIDADGAVLRQITLPLQDTEGPEIAVSELILLDQIPPELIINDLTFGEGHVSISGFSQDSTTITIKGKVNDISGVSQLLVNGNLLSLGEKNTFSVSLTLSDEIRETGIVRIEALDGLGNRSQEDIPVLSELSRPIITINGTDVYVDSEGHFNAELNLTSAMQSIVVTARDVRGNTTAPEELLLPDKIAPKVRLGDLSYTTHTVVVSGTTEPLAVVTVGDEQVSADETGFFWLEIARPHEPVQLTVEARDASSNVSEALFVAVKPVVDEFPPRLLVSELDTADGHIIVEGWVEDDVEVAKLTIQGQDVSWDTTGYFREEITPADDEKTVTIEACDSTEKFVKTVKAIQDFSPPALSIEPLAFSNGTVIVRGTARDDIALREVRVNNVPVSIPIPQGGDFKYETLLTATLTEVVIEAIDSSGNVTKEGPIAVQLPPDKGTPTLMADNLKFGSPQIIVTGVISDDVGIKNVAINGEPITVYEDGAYKAVIPLKVASPRIEATQMQYLEGALLLTGRVTLGSISPNMIVITGEDLSGNEAPSITRPIDTSGLDEIRVFVNGEPISVSGGIFQAEVAFSKDLKAIEISAIDPFDVTGGPVLVELEKNAPEIELEDLKYENGSVIVSGLARDEESGVEYVEINGVRIDVDTDGHFQKELSDQVKTVRVAAYDRLGNRTEAPILTVEPPDVYPPYFKVSVSPVPACTESTASIIVDSFDEGFPEEYDLLSEPPTAVIRYSDGSEEEITLRGDETHFEAALAIAKGSPIGVATLTISGTDTAGNTGERIEGADSFMITSSDTIAPILTVAVDPAAGPTIGSEMLVIITASESLKAKPRAALQLPDGTQAVLTLEGEALDLHFQAHMVIDPATMPGEALIIASGGVDLAGNQQAEDVSFSFQIRPPFIETALPLEIQLYEFSGEKLLLKGVTEPGAIVHFSFDVFEGEVFAGETGTFEFIREFDEQTLKDLRKKTKALNIESVATNYAGLSSETVSLFIDLPKAKKQPQAVKGAFTVQINPRTLEQGKPGEILVTAGERLNLPPEITVRLMDGSMIGVVMSGSGKQFKGVFTPSMNAFPGPAMVEAKAEALLATTRFTIAPPTYLFTAAMGRNLYTITASPDPALIGKECRVSVKAGRDIDWVPTCQIMHQGGVIDVPLAGSKTEFGGVAVIPEYVSPGPARIVIDEGKPTKFERPFSIALPRSDKKADIHAAVWTEPTPMIAGQTARILLNADTMIDFLPAGFIQFSDGARLNFTCNGAAPGMRFSADVTIPEQAAVGIVFVKVLDRAGAVIGETSSGVAPRVFSGADMSGSEVRAFAVPEPMRVGARSTIMVDLDRDVSFIPKVKLILSDMRMLRVEMFGPVPGRHFEGGFDVPMDAVPGPVGIEVRDTNGTLIGGGGSYIEEYNYKEDRELYILINPPSIGPGDNLTVTVNSDKPITFVPGAALRFGNGRIEKIVLTEVNKGLRFQGSLLIRPDAFIGGALIEVYDKNGTILNSMPVPVRMPDYSMQNAMMPRDIGIMVNPEPPQQGKNLAIELRAPFKVNFIPRLFARFLDGSSFDLAVSGQIPTDQFRATLTASQFKSPLMALDVESPDGMLLFSRPFDMHFMSLPFDVRPFPEGPDMIRLEWDYVDGAARYKIEYRRSDGAFKVIDAGNGTRYMLSGLTPGNTYFIQVRALGMSGSELALTPEVMASTFQDAAMSVGRIEVMPFPPQPGMPLEIHVEVPQAMQMPPRLAVWFKNGTRKDVGAGGGPYHFQAFMGPLPDFLERIEVIHPRDGRMLFSEHFEMQQAMGYQGPPPSVSVNPDPPVAGTDCVIRVAFPYPVPFIPNISIGMTDGSEIYQPMSGKFGDMAFTYTLTASRHTSAINIVEIEDMQGMILESRIFVGSGGAQAMVKIDPYPPQPYVPLQIRAEFDQSVTYRPTIIVEFTNGMSQRLTTSGGVPGSIFTAMLDGPMYSQPIELIDVEDNKGMLVGTMSLAGLIQAGATTAGPVPIGHIEITPNPAQPGKPLEIRVESPQAMSRPPKIAAWFMNGQRQEVPATGGPYSFKAFLSSLPDYLDAIDILDPVTGSVLYSEHYGMQGDGGYYGTPPALYANPNPPVVGTNCVLRVEFPNPVYFVPKLTIYFDDGAQFSVAMNGSPGVRTYNYTVTAAEHRRPIRMIDVQDNRNAVIASQTFAGTAGQYQGAPPALMVNPDPPTVATNVYVQVNFPQ